ncbi:hypothetical protein EG68_00890 [Paragonimus skrjabini miyazakii]|uniref:SCP domain-containing protein n=1 Tax=Paragonimus skrjabini miyazakii TaxID=59628 RepID=A0A8S9Z7Y9_9TREM|nr:hypothetical protein EG68_00890 [Paragonimus skrjabini miyazakii]
MLNIHNHFRRAVTTGAVRPCAAPMPDLTWDSALASALQKWPEGCVSNHDKKRGDVGENLYFTTSRKSKLFGPIQ